MCRKLVVVLALCMSIVFAGCSSNSQMYEVSVSRDAYGKVMQKTIYNIQTGHTYLLQFTYFNGNEHGEVSSIIVIDKDGKVIVGNDAEILNIDDTDLRS